jgi:hypothetical protein
MAAQKDSTVTLTLAESDVALLTEAVSEMIYELTHHMSPPSSRGAGPVPEGKVHPDVRRLQRLYDVLERAGRAAR